MAYLEIKNFKKSFGNVSVLKGIDFSLEKGQVLSIIGPSGSGKSTLLRSLNFLETPDQGVMTLDNEVLFDASISKKDSENLLRNKRLNFGLVFQSFNLFPQYNVLKNITLAPTLLLEDKVKDYKKELKQDKSLSFGQRRAKINEFKKQQKEEIEKNAIALLEQMGLSEKINSYPCELSGGQSQRVAITRALALNPKILCFDEPTSALDPELTGEVLKAIRSLKDQDRTMIIVTHEMGFAKNVSDKIIFLYDGVVEEEGKPNQVFNKPKSEILAHFLSSISDKEGEINEKPFSVGDKDGKIE